MSFVVYKSLQIKIFLTFLFVIYLLIIKFEPYDLSFGRVSFDINWILDLVDSQITSNV